MQRSAIFAGVLLAGLMTAPFWASVSTAQADEAPERERLALIAQQLKVIERQARDAELIARSKPQDTRYHFDYVQFQVDLKRVRAGVDAYLNPARLQPRDVSAIPGHYTRERGSR
jgi:RAQPRD family integrative conjugative element protein